MRVTGWTQSHLFLWAFTCTTVNSEYACASGLASEFSDRIQRHDAVRDVLFAAAQTAAGPMQRSPLSHSKFFQLSGRHFLPTLERGRPAPLDVIIIISPMQHQIQAWAATVPGYALRVGENRKLAVHLGECWSQGIDFCPMAAESLGGWSDDAISIIQRVGHMLCQRLGVSPSICSRQLFQKL